MTEPAPLPKPMASPLHPPHFDQGWENIRVEHLQNPGGGEGPYHCEDEHTLFISLASRPVHYVHRQDGQTHVGLHRPGDLLITPANTHLFARWEGDEDCLQIQLSDLFLKRIAAETFKGSDRLQLIPAFQQRDAQVEAIAHLMLTESQQHAAGNQLYMDSLANILAVNLLRQFATTQPQLPVYPGGLPTRQLQRIFDYIDAHLDQEIKLANLAGLLGMSQFHFSHLFKQSLGISPYQYLLQQRVARAKQFLKQTDRSIAEIALDCGFNSHSHLSKQFRQFTGLTPKAFRVS